ncbi:hypothetical protein NC653_031940 [Populus alba x Populus x berolinensis]|uniref:Uncharacterized protein n=2 Tax=Populus TaxID=3689 RepID=A0A4U5QJT7_POPAL|nr:hypothetical protein NC653_031940 [Populus alba x Populus x berolinensis]TKS10923.1 hypothetical protein D5086_0000078280 [Populus alba]
MNSVFVLMHFTWFGYDAAAWVMHGLVQAGSSVVDVWDASLMKVVYFKASCFYMRKMNIVFILLHFTWSGCYMGNAWVGPSGFFFGRHMGCKFNDSCVFLCGINFKAGYIKLVQAGSTYGIPASPPDYSTAELVSSFFVSPMVSPMLEPLFHSIRLETERVRRDFLEILTAKISKAGVLTHKSVFFPTILGPDKLDGGLISFSPTFSVKDLPFVWPDRVSGFSFVHIHIVHIVIVGVDFSTHPDDDGFFEGFSSWNVVPLCNRASGLGRVFLACHPL